MLTYFPTPYPHEWWYSVLCRYYVRSGYHNHATALRELYGTRPLIHGRLFPGASCAAIISRLPSRILDVEHILLHHTLMPYYLRFYPPEKKRAMLNTLCSGKSAGLTSIELKSPEGKEGPKYCPVCYREDAEVYGEPYWRREHQIPLIPLCPKHGCRLVQYEIRFGRLSELFLPLCAVVPEREAVGKEKGWEVALTDMLMAYLTMAFYYGTTQGYNNLQNALVSKRLNTNKIGGKVALDVNKVYQACLDFYGPVITSQYFSKLSPAILYRIGNWTLTSPERYALLTVMAGLTAKELFGPEVVVKDNLLEQLLEYRGKGTAYRKEQLAGLLGVTPSQLDSLARKYKVKPFWKQCERGESKRTNCIRITLTEEEKRLLYQAAKRGGDGQPAVFARSVLLREARRIIKGELSNENGTKRV